MPQSDNWWSSRANPWHLTEDLDENSMWLAWLVRLRWVAIVAQLVTLAAAWRMLDHTWVVIPLLLCAVGALVLTNLWALRQLHASKAISNLTLLLQLLLDVGVLTLFFLAAGGMGNPFVPLYLIYVAMGAVILSSKEAFLLMSGVVAANILITVGHLPLHFDQHALSPRVVLALSQVSAMTVTVLSVGFFVLGMATTLRLRKHRLLEIRERAAQTDRLRAVGTLAAGAAHELNTPLSTIGLRLRRIARRHKDDDTASDLDVMRTQLERCSDIVERLLVGAGDPSASGIERTTLQNLVERSLKMWAKGSPIDVELSMSTDPIYVELPGVAFTQAFINLLENAREAQAEIDRMDPLRVEVRNEAKKGVVRIIDHGPGLPPAAHRVGEPFFTTKTTGTGLGVFVARALADGAGGGLTYLRDGDCTLTLWTFQESRRAP